MTRISLASVFSLHIFSWMETKATFLLFVVTFQNRVCKWLISAFSVKCHEISAKKKSNDSITSKTKAFIAKLFALDVIWQLGKNTCNSCYFCSCSWESSTPPPLTGFLTWSSLVFLLKELLWSTYKVLSRTPNYFTLHLCHLADALIQNYLHLSRLYTWVHTVEAYRACSRAQQSQLSSAWIRTLDLPISSPPS